MNITNAEKSGDTISWHYCCEQAFIEKNSFQQIKIEGKSSKNIQPRMKIISRDRKGAEVRGEDLGGLRDSILPDLWPPNTGLRRK
jgi:hypothetical protein